MATRSWVKIATPHDGTMALYHLSGGEVLAGNDVAAALFVGHRNRISVHIVGTLAAAAVTIRGSNKDAPNPATAGDWVTMTDKQGNTIAPTAAAFETLQDQPLYLSAIAAAGVTQADIYVLLGSENTRSE